MSYPKWLTRDTLQTCYGMAVHNGCLYVAGDDGTIYRVDSWCEDQETGKFVPTSAPVINLPAVATAMESALGYLWMSTGDAVYYYNATTDVLSGPYPYCVGEEYYSSGTPINMVLFDGEVHMIQRAWITWMNNRLEIWKFNGAEMVQVLIAGAAINHQPYPYYNLEVFGGELYFGVRNTLCKWDGISMTVVHSFPTYFHYYSVGALLVIDGLLYIGTGVGQAESQPDNVRVWTYNGISVSLVKEFSQTGAPTRFAYRAPELLIANYKYSTSGYVGCYNLSTGAFSWKYVSGWGASGQYRNIAFDESDEVLWVNYKHNLVYVSKPCAVASTYYFLA